MSSMSYCRLGCYGISLKGMWPWCSQLTLGNKANMSPVPI